MSIEDDLDGANKFPALEVAKMSSVFSWMKNDYQEGKHVVDCSAIHRYDDFLNNSRFYLRIREELSELHSNTQKFESSITEGTKESDSREYRVPTEITNSIVKESYARFRRLNEVTNNMTEEMYFDQGYKERIDGINDYVKGIGKAENYCDLLSLSKLYNAVLWDVLSDLNVKNSWNYTLSGTHVIDSAKKIRNFMEGKQKIRFRTGELGKVHSFKDLDKKWWSF